jgi:hypothetical protein
MYLWDTYDSYIKHEWRIHLPKSSVTVVYKQYNISHGIFYINATLKTISVSFSPQANYTDCATATYWRNLVPTFADRGVFRGQRGVSPTVVNLSF